MSITGYGGFYAGYDEASFRASLTGPAKDDPRRQKPPKKPLYKQLQERAAEPFFCSLDDLILD